jgi:hypothetical protein
MSFRVWHLASSKGFDKQEKPARQEGDIRFDNEEFVVLVAK